MPHNWTITVDLQEKKRAQNRIAQRNHSTFLSQCPCRFLCYFSHVHFLVSSHDNVTDSSVGQRIKDRIANLQLELDKSENKRKKLEGAQAPSDSEQDGESIPFPAAMEENSVWNFGLISPGETVTSSQDAGCIRNQHGEGSVITPDGKKALDESFAHRSSANRMSCQNHAYWRLPQPMTPSYHRRKPQTGLQVTWSPLP